MEKQTGITSLNLKSQTVLKKYYSGKARFYNKDLVNIQSANSAKNKGENGSTISNTKVAQKNS